MHRTSPRRLASFVVVTAATLALILSGPNAASAASVRAAPTSPAPTPTATRTPTPTPTQTPVRAFTSAPRPTITGTLRVGSTVTAVSGAWAPTATIRYQWRLDGAAVSGATSRTFALPAGSLGKRVTVTVTATRAGYRTTSTTSAASVAVARGTLVRGSLKVAGAPTVGSTLTASAPGFGPAPVSFAWQWSRDGKAIPGATRHTYAPVTADLDRKLTVRVSLTKPGYTGVALTSAAVTVGRAFTAAPTPTISGTVSVGSTVKVASAAWKPTPATLTYQWLRGGKAIAGATGSSYKIVAADAGVALSVRVRAAKGGYTPVSRTSAGVAVPRVLTVPGTVTISGTGTVRETLTAQPGAWGPGTVTFAYQWLRGGSPIAGATARTYRPVAADAGKVVSVRITGARSGYTTVVRTSAGTSVFAAFTATPTPTISGTLKAGSTLSVQTGQWQPSSTALRVQWRVDGGAIAGATGQAWQVPTWAAGRSVTVSVTATKKDYRTVTKTSAAKKVSWSLGDTITPGTTLRTGVQLTSPDGRYAFKMLGDGNVAVTRGYALVRTAKTTGTLDGTLVFTGDGELMLLNENDVALWSSKTAGLGATALRLGNDGILRLLDGEGKAVWTSLRMPVVSDATAAGSSVPGRYGWAYPLRPNGSFTTYAGHSGDDIAAPTGTPVYTMRGGTVSLREVWITSGCPSWAPNKSKQKEVVVTSTVDGTKIVQVYAHLSAFSVKAGQTVAAGQRIGAVGSTGCSTGPHLHTAFTVDGVRYALYPRDVLGTASY
ncbi:peptidoglycan DD-metalloendopeptidase family protein [Microbacterium oleivorans]|uniref:peptidoglycan DD-metalloendopeptidase family protein n=1 Tax=Microbacterium oleivorans TaxID=273677 RepID=UPI000A8B1A84|nr:peptidoglycan DD-metalloendopeptidase family protein [Microbacterium oleivorans]